MTRRAVVLDPHNAADCTLIMYMLGTYALRWTAEEIAAHHRLGPVTDDPVYVSGGRIHARRYRCAPDGRVLVVGDDGVIVRVSKRIPIDIQRTWRHQRAEARSSNTRGAVR